MVLTKALLPEVKAGFWPLDIIDEGRESVGA